MPSKKELQEQINWLDELIEFYDFVWKYGIQAHGRCINAELIDDFQSGGNEFEMMKKSIIKKFPSKEAAIKSFKKHLEGFKKK